MAGLLVYHAHAICYVNSLYHSYVSCFVHYYTNKKAYNYCNIATFRCPLVNCDKYISPRRAANSLTTKDMSHLKVNKTLSPPIPGKTFMSKVAYISRVFLHVVSGKWFTGVIT